MVRPQDCLWHPRHKDSPRQFECTRQITAERSKTRSADLAKAPPRFNMSGDFRAARGRRPRQQRDVSRVDNRSRADHFRGCRPATASYESLMSSAIHSTWSFPGVLRSKSRRIDAAAVEGHADQSHDTLEGGHGHISIGRIRASSGRRAVRRLRRRNRSSSSRPGADRPKRRNATPTRLLVLISKSKASVSLSIARRSVAAHRRRRHCGQVRRSRLISSAVPREQ